jgi:PAS domain S-box-containing protein
MSRTPNTGSPNGLANGAFDRQLREMNEALLVASVRQHELAEQAQRAEAAMRKSETRYRRLFESAKDGILTLDAVSGEITDANPSMVQLLGYPREELLGKELWQIGLLHDVNDSREMVGQLQKTGYIRYEDLPLETAAGQSIEVEVVANVYQEDHEPVIQCNIRDITARSLLEHKTQDQAKSLADLDHRKDEFLAMLSHELRSPLAPIRNAVELLRLQRDGTPLQMEAHAIIERQVGQLARLVDDLLEVSRISTGRIHLQEERIDLRGIVDRAIETTQPQTGQKGQSVAKSLPAEPIWVYGDPVRLEQVVVNLLNNSCKYTDRGGHIWIGLKQGGDEAVLRVRDNGIGIAPEMLPHIFDLFTQADKSLDRSQGGLGIGLSLVRSLVTMHRGRVEAQSTPGQGSEFIVKLPVLLSPHVPTVVPPEDVPAPARALKVLVVDDNMDTAKVMAMLLRAIGHDARLAHDGASAVQAALEYVPDVVLLDIGLPVIDGYEVAKWIRQEPTLKDVMLVALTGYAQESDKRRSREAGFDHHLVKPMDFTKVESILAAVVVKVQ